MAFLKKTEARESTENQVSISNRFRVLATSTLISTLLLILVGGLVRVSGAGLGCPDWPRCWGCWLPPADISVIDPVKYDISQYNKTKMWIEYANRMVGVVIGLLIMSTFVCSFKYRKSNPPLFWASLVAFVLVVFQGWLGGVVVKSGLKPGIITLHMVMAMTLLTLLVWIVYKTKDPTQPVQGSSKLLNGTAMLFCLVIVQVVMGTQVRESIDPILKLEGTTSEVPRDEWLTSAGYRDHLHRFFSWAVLISAFVLLRKSRILPSFSAPKTLTICVFALVITQIVIGISLAYLSLPPLSQVLHLANSAVLICGIVFLWLNCKEDPTLQGNID